jgi:hypothetical protein
LTAADSAFLGIQFAARGMNTETLQRVSDSEHFVFLHDAYNPWEYGTL